ncbi:hypothetical protein [Geoalkalibacter subterraneus]|uniref:Uncharacterized protein n=1 Tax=Geoalkalibacter subterraneus TaxID=483547 RepID=A0A0B5FLC8_9BACT|nr:hypothetical protein [Geoalkalibacter subterraneus]AJF08208.1 hypothetical protein GSUB_17110 [Geoalkalibacter subterraneus]
MSFFILLYLFSGFTTAMLVMGKIWQHGRIGDLLAQHSRELASLKEEYPEKFNAVVEFFVALILIFLWPFMVAELLSRK